ncbi:MAG TPA: hypothetical protein VFC82_09005 [Actinomycetaceae bacterium]|nr:hypothetical protein [Actinomycetaceae bacterium]
MRILKDDPDCQVAGIAGTAVGPQEKFRRSPKLAVRRRLGPARARKVEARLNSLKNKQARLMRRQEKPAVVPPRPAEALVAGDWVRVRSLEEIEATLDHSRKLKGCSFAADMVQYCGTRQQVLKPVRRFVDERDLAIINTRGLVLLDGAMCTGTPAYGPCDRSCFFFWREEWLEKLDVE